MSTPGRHVDLISPIDPERALLWRRRAGADGGSISDEELWHDWAAHGVAPAEAVSEPPLIVPGVAHGAEHGARQCTGAILYEEIALAANKTRVSNS